MDNDGDIVSALKGLLKWINIVWITKAAFVETLKLNGGNRPDNDKISDKEFLEATKIIEGAILAK